MNYNQCAFFSLFVGTLNVHYYARQTCGEIIFSLSNAFCIFQFFSFIKISRQQLTDQLTQHKEKKLLIRLYLLAKYGSQLNLLNESHNKT